MKRTKPFPFHILVFLLPATLIYTVFMTYPLFDSIRLSFFATDASGAESFVGLQNYVTLLTNDSGRRVSGARSCTTSSFF